MDRTMLGRVLVLCAFAAACGGGESAPASGGGASGGGETGAATSSTPPAEGGAGSVDLPAGVTTAMVDQGRQLFNGSSGSCFACHGQGGADGALAPDLTDDDWINTDGTYEGIVEVINTGVEAPKEYPGVMLPRAGMPLSDDDVAALAAYVWSLAHTDM